MNLVKFILVACIGSLLFSCTEENRDSTNLGKTQQQSQQVQFAVPFESVTLDNGLQVIFHVDRSDPVVAVALTSHVGSAREEPGRTGFTHLLCEQLACLYKFHTASAAIND
jgi:zinc protease